MSVSDSGQAGALEIEITPRMIEAGVCALLDADASTLAYQAEVAFLAMQKVAYQESLPSRLKEN